MISLHHKRKIPLSKANVQPSLKISHNFLGNFSCYHNLIFTSMRQGLLQIVKSNGGKLFKNMSLFCSHIQQNSKL